MSFNFQNLSQSFARPATSAVVSAVISMLIDGSADPVSIFGHSVPLAVANGISGALAVEASDLAHKFILPYIPVSQKWSRSESHILTPILQAIINYGLLSIIAPGRWSGEANGGFLTSSIALNTGIMSAIQGGASEYVYEGFVEPWVRNSSPKRLAQKQLWGRL